MTCVLGIVVDREREIRNFEKTPFYRVMAGIDLGGKVKDAEWRVTPDSHYDGSPELYSEKGFKTEESANRLISSLVGMNGAQLKKSDDSDDESDDDSDDEDDSDEDDSVLFGFTVP